MRLRIVPLTLRQANALVGEWHRHHALAVGHRWSLGVMYGDDLVALPSSAAPWPVRFLSIPWLKSTAWLPMATGMVAASSTLPALERRPPWGSMRSRPTF